MAPVHPPHIGRLPNIRNRLCLRSRSLGDFSDNLWLDPMDAEEDKRRAEARKPLNGVVRANSTGPQERTGRARPLYRALPELSSRSQSRDPTGGID